MMIPLSRQPPDTALMYECWRSEYPRPKLTRWRNHYSALVPLGHRLFRRRSSGSSFVANPLIRREESLLPKLSDIGRTGAIVLTSLLLAARAAAEAPRPVAADMARVHG